MARRKAKSKADVAYCKGCYLCIGNCPVNAISQTTEVNKKGYEVIRVDEDKCIGCGGCYRICPDYVFTIE